MSLFQSGAPVYISVGRPARTAATEPRNDRRCPASALTSDSVATTAAGKARAQWPHSMDTASASASGASTCTSTSVAAVSSAAASGADAEYDTASTGVSVAGTTRSATSAAADASPPEPVAPRSDTHTATTSVPK